MRLSSPNTIAMASPVRPSSPIRPLMLTAEPRKQSISSFPPIQPASQSSSRKSSITPIPLGHAPSNQGRSSRESSLSEASSVADTFSVTRSSSMSAPEVSTPADVLFSSSLISQEVVKQLPEGYGIRPLAKGDFKAGMLDVLRVLTTVGDISEEAWLERFDYMKKREGDYYLIVVEDADKKIVGTGGVIVERKFIRNLGLVGHIEDIAVAKDQQGKKLGLRIIEALDHIAKSVGCYKAILDCSEANEGFYLKCGYKRAGLEMSHYY